MTEHKSDCKNCSAFKECKDSTTSWIFLFIGLLATISIRLVNLVLHLDPFWPKLFWYVGVAGFFLYFIYKFRQTRLLQKRVAQNDVARKLAAREPLNGQDYEFLDSIFCRLRSRKDAVNYFFIFFTSGLVLAIAIYQDFIKN